MSFNLIQTRSSIIILSNADWQFMNEDYSWWCSGFLLCGNQALEKFLLVCIHWHFIHSWVYYLSQKFLLTIWPLGVTLLSFKSTADTDQTKTSVIAEQNSSRSETLTHLELQIVYNRCIVLYLCNTIIYTCFIITTDHRLFGDRHIKIETRQASLL